MDGITTVQVSSDTFSMWKEFKTSSEKQPEVLPALTTFSLLLHTLGESLSVCLKICCPFRNGGLEVL